MTRKKWIYTDLNWGNDIDLRIFNDPLRLSDLPLRGFAREPHFRIPDNSHRM